MYADDYPEVEENLARRSIAVLVKEEKAFRRTLTKGLKQLTTFAKAGPVGGPELFTLYDTFGFPVELSHRGGAHQGHRAHRELAGGVRREDGRAAAPRRSPEARAGPSPATCPAGHLAAMRQSSGLMNDQSSPSGPVTVYSRKPYGWSTGS